MKKKKMLHFYLIPIIVVGVISFLLYCGYIIPTIIISMIYAIYTTISLFIPFPINK